MEAENQAGFLVAGFSYRLRPSSDPIPLSIPSAKRLRNTLATASRPHPHTRSSTKAEPTLRQGRLREGRKTGWLHSAAPAMRPEPSTVSQPPKSRVDSSPPYATVVTAPANAPFR